MLFLIIADHGQCGVSGNTEIPQDSGDARKVSIFYNLDVPVGVPCYLSSHRPVSRRWNEVPKWNGVKFS